MARELGLTREERNEIAFMLHNLNVDDLPASWGGSWYYLTDEQLDLMFDYLYGYHLVSTLLAMRDPSKEYKYG